MRHMSGLLAVLAVPGFVDDEDAIFVRLRRRVFPKQP
jgi:hypothetical protein